MVQGKDGKMRLAQYKDIVILMRSVKSNAGIYVEQLMNMGIPAYADSKSGFFDSMEVETIMNMLTIIDNPRQDIPLVSVLTSAMFNFTDDELAVIKGDNRKISILYWLIRKQEMIQILLRKFMISLRNLIITENWIIRIPYMKL